MFSITPKEILKDEERKDVLLNTKIEENINDLLLTKTQIQNLTNESNRILSAVNSFFFKEIIYSAIIILILGFIVMHIADKPNTFYRSFAFMTGAILNFLSCYITVIVSSGSNYRIAYKSLYVLYNNFYLI